MIGFGLIILRIIIDLLVDYFVPLAADSGLAKLFSPYPVTSSGRYA
jgi:hypothetical protein